MRVLGKVPASDAALVRSDLNDLGPTRLRDVEEARQRIAQLARRLGLNRPHRPGTDVAATASSDGARFLQEV